ncbi:MAG: hypothetical protein ACYDGR_16690, partial [Candidatus Dormibacteria bacterium]
MQGSPARRVPPLVMGALALALMIAILPSSLHLPITGPGSQAEVAPVPGQGRTQANLSQLGLADSGTVGAAGSSALADAGRPTPLAELLQGLAPGAGTVAQQAHCVGNPPRQTEDPLSPPCVASWQGDNGGSTGKGVSRNSVTIVVADGHYGNDGEDYSNPVPATNDSSYDLTFKILTRYFQSRFQTYGRVVRVINQRGSGKQTNGVSGGNVIYEADAEQAYHPFGIVALWDAPASYQQQAAKNHTMVWIGTRRSSPDLPTRATLAAAAPYEWSFDADAESSLTTFTHWVCTSLAGKKAARANDPSIALQPRRFGVVGGGNVEDALRQGCGLDVKLYNSSSAANVAQMKADGVTTVIGNFSGNTTMLQAEQVGYFPEWLMYGDSFWNT